MFAIRRLATPPLLAPHRASSNSPLVYYSLKRFLSTPKPPTMPIDLYNTATPNGKKIYIFAEEVGLEFNHHRISFKNNDQFKPEFLAINPNNKIPAIVDNNPPAEFGPGPVNVFESGAILQYLADYKTPAGAPVLYSKNPRTRTIINQWLYFQAGGLGPMMGQFGWFKNNKASAKDEDDAKLFETGFKRYGDEVVRLFGVLERRLTGDNVLYLAGDEYSIADIMNWSWAINYGLFPLEIENFPGVKAWLDRIAAREGVKKGLAKSAELNP